MLIYEVTLNVQPEIVAAFRAWLPGHIKEVLALDGFASARLFETDPQAETTDFTVLYELVDRPALDRYLAEHAERMRGDGLARFGGQFTASRRIHRQLAVYDSHS